MNFITIIIIAIGLSMDSFAVSIANGLIIKKLSFYKALSISLTLGIFHIIMPLTGWLLGSKLNILIHNFDHWLAFLLLSFIGGKMIYESLNSKQEPKTLKLKTFIIQSFATSIDALAVGLSFAILDMNIISPILIIGLTCFLFSFLGLYIGKFIGDKLGSTVELFGGLILIGIGTKILIEHLFF